MACDIISEAFLEIRNRLFDENKKPIPFYLRPKTNTQDDPFDEYLANNVLSKLKNVITKKAPGALISPDIILFRPTLCNENMAKFKHDATYIAGLEVKKIEFKKSGKSRTSNIDFNTTPPCGTIRIHDKENKPIDIKGFYLFACLDKTTNNKLNTIATSLILSDGDLLNDDFSFYLSIVGERNKKVGIGSYKDGIDRTRPMITFPSPLMIPELKNTITLIHSSPTLAIQNDNFRMSHVIKRTKENDEKLFCCYQFFKDVALEIKPEMIVNPFHVPKNRSTKTSQRGRFILDLWMNQK